MWEKKPGSRHVQYETDHIASSSLLKLKQRENLFHTCTSVLYLNHRTAQVHQSVCDYLVCQRIEILINDCLLLVSKAGMFSGKPPSWICKYESDRPSLELPNTAQDTKRHINHLCTYYFVLLWSVAWSRCKFWMQNWSRAQWRGIGHRPFIW